MEKHRRFIHVDYENDHMNNQTYKRRQTDKNDIFYQIDMHSLLNFDIHKIFLIMIIISYTEHYIINTIHSTSHPILVNS